MYVPLLLTLSKYFPKSKAVYLNSQKQRFQLISEDKHIIQHVLHWRCDNNLVYKHLRWFRQRAKKNIELTIFYLPQNMAHMSNFNVNDVKRIPKKVHSTSEKQPVEWGTQEGERAQGSGGRGEAD